MIRSMYFVAAMVWVLAAPAFAAPLQTDHFSDSGNSFSKQKSAFGASSSTAAASSFDRKPVSTPPQALPALSTDGSGTAAAPSRPVASVPRAAVNGTPILAGTPVASAPAPTQVLPLTPAGPSLTTSTAGLSASVPTAPVSTRVSGGTVQAPVILKTASGGTVTLPTINAAPTRPAVSAPKASGSEFTKEHSTASTEAAADTAAALPTPVASFKVGAPVKAESSDSLR